jgi:hypothetical protein
VDNQNNNINGIIRKLRMRILLDLGSVFWSELSLIGLLTDLLFPMEEIVARSAIPLHPVKSWFSV